MIRDLELIVDNLNTKIQENFQTYVDSTNTRKSDDIVIPDFEADFLFVFEPLRNFPASGVSYYLGPMMVNPDTDSGSMRATALKHVIMFSVIVRENALGNQTRLSHRYLDMLMRMFNGKILLEMKDLYITDVDILPYEIGDSGISAYGPAIFFDTSIAY